MAALSCSWLSLPSKMNNLSITSHYSSPTMANSSSLSFSRTLSPDVFSLGCRTLNHVRRPIRHSVVCEAAPKRKADSAEKRARQSEKRRLQNKSRKSEIRTRMKKVLEALEVLRKKPDAQAEEILPVEKLIAEAYSVIDRAVRTGTVHRNTGARRKSRLARRKKAIEILRGWYIPEPAVNASEPVTV